ncbi:MAG: ABC transporter ATP-binding protein [Peptostreptococcaceae bacterium]
MQIKLNNICKVYKNKKNPNLDKIALQNANLVINKGETVGILGESGGGKSTLGQIISGLIKPTSGEMYIDENKISYPFQKNMRRKVQVLFQHPEVSFNPKLSLLKSLEEPYKIYNKEFCIDKLVKDIEKFGLYEDHLYRKPSQLSGGELQRAALARILSVDPDFIILDEPTSMLDVISQAQIMKLLSDIQNKKDIGFLFITHDEKLCEIFSDRIYDINKGILKVKK